MPDTPSAKKGSDYIGKHTLIPAGVAIAAVLLAWNLSGSATDRLVRIELSIESLAEDVGELRTAVHNSNGTHVSHSEFRQWAELMKAQNPEVDVPIPR